VRLGARGAGDEHLPLHSPRFDIDEQVLKTGSAYFEQVAREAIRRGRLDV